MGNYAKKKIVSFHTPIMCYKQRSDLATSLQFLALLVSVAYYQKS